MKTTFDNGMTCHVWAQQSQDHGKNSNGSLNFNGSTICSYAMNIAKFVNDNVVLFTSEGYSVTTSQHKSLIRSAIPSYVTVFTVPNVDVTVGTKHEYTKKKNKLHHKLNLEYYKKEIANLVLSASRARSNKDILSDQALSMVSECNSYITEFKLRNKKVELPDSGQLLLDAKKAKKAEKAKKARIEREVLKENKIKIEQWQNGENVRLPYSVNLTMLRVIGDEIQTSKNASFPVKHGYLALNIIKKCKAEKTSFKKNGRSIKLGYFEIDSIDANGNVKAGCHNVNYEQIMRIEKDILIAVGK